MAFNASTEWDVRSTGSDSNGGGFNTAATGTNYSVQDSPQFTYTDLVIDGTTNTKCTSAAHPFDSTSPGNIINVTGGTGFSVQRVQVVSVAGSTATCDKSLGTLSSTGGTGNLGGGLLTLPTAVTLAITNNCIHLKTATYTLGAMQDVQAVRMFGYGTAHYDNGSRPTITNNASMVYMFHFTGGSAGEILFSNLIVVDTQSSTALVCLIGSTAISFFNTKWSGFATFINNGASGFSNLTAVGMEISSGSSNMVIDGSVFALDCYIHGTTSNSFGGALISVDRCIFYNTAGVPVVYTANPAGKMRVVNSSFSSNTGTACIYASNGLPLALPFVIENCIFYGSTGFAIDSASGADKSYSVIRYNAYGSNSGGNLNNVTSLGNDVTLSADPFTNKSGGDFSLNSTAGGGAACKAVGFPGAFPGGTTTVTKQDLGAAQTTGSAAAGGGSFTFIG